MEVLTVTVRDAVAARLERSAGVAEDVFTLERPAWHARAACRSEGVALFFEYSGQPAAARAVCARCPVLEPCQVQGLEAEDAGVWGGLTERDRRRVRRRRARTGEPWPVAVVAVVPEVRRAR